MEQTDLELDVIVNGEPLPKEKNADGQDVVILPVRQDESEILPYYLLVTVKPPIDPNFPNFVTLLTIDGHESTTEDISKSNELVLKIPTIDNDLLGFGPIPRSIVPTSSSTEGLQQLGEIKVDVFSCKRAGETIPITPTAYNRPQQHSVKGELKKFEKQSTKWKTVSAGTVPPPGQSIPLDMGPFQSSISLQYMDWATMEHNRRVMAPIVPEPEVIEIIQPEVKPEQEIIDLTAHEDIQVGRPGRGVKRELVIFDLT